ncbi:hypothetical protein CHLRE_12g489950v5 [Chlamydomonas reinhardtii]|uniref:Uncharacterized protein n=1 Tax=Chlamydomonas reinhardtii TaxID=3055 RepID=A8ILL2_CHLRE|nr:uncharacterized protein CHLRE_12g489950v5 [Chlamydomonas reinhardtii]PNW74621.1 hypothetical protein CHLRE_12g489950v5 [Chlamydomonas reinhardtii]|eukprot:XP_001691117.1 predicted protein [Chlamydomonas reinhardtii]
MSEVELANGAPAEEAAGEVQEEQEEELDEEATALLQELEDSQAEVQRMLADQRAQATELGGMKDSLASELQQLQDDAWKLQVFAELEMLKRQLAAINSLDADLDAMEAKLEDGGEDAVDDDFEKELAAARVGTRDLLSRLAGGAGGDADAVAAVTTSTPAASGATGEGEAAASGDDVEALQDELDAELAAMYKQLQAIKTESAMVSARKAQLELELMQLIREGADDLTEQLQGMAVEEGEGEGEGTAAGAGIVEGAVTAAQQSVAEAAST